ncbi:MAG TPA: hypothetical protein VF364_12250 [Candidatus Limnocylindria bacterium]
MDLAVVLDLITLGVLTVGGFALATVGLGLQAGVKTSAEEGARIAIDNVNWPNKLGQELQKVRGTERQELRFGAYAALWAKQRPLAIYDAGIFNEKAAKKLSGELSDWYFSDTGGLLLSKQVRDFYFALQDLLRAVGAIPRWRAVRPQEDAAQIFLRVLKREQLDNARKTIVCLKRLDEPGVDPEEWAKQAATLAKEWRADIRKLHGRWGELSSNEHFAVLQQVASILRTSMVNDVESRSR